MSPPSAVHAWRREVVLPDGTHISIRPLTPELPGERDREIAFLNELSERTRYMRMLTPLRYLPPHMLDQFMDVDGERRMALVATSELEDGEHFIGVARYAVTDDPLSAEIGITVADAWHHRGVASRLMRCLMEYAKEHGIRTLTGLVLPENQSMLTLARHLGFEVRLASPEQLMKITRTL